MRLFIAVNFDQTAKTALSSTTERLKKYADSGKFTQRENLHLTLVFIGETKNIQQVKETMNCLSARTFDISLHGLGHFTRTGGNIYWLAVRHSAELMHIAQFISSTLREKGFSVEKREFCPHLTLGREVVMKNTFDLTAFDKETEEISQKVSSVDLMKSERINGRLVYTKIFSKILHT